MVTSILGYGYKTLALMLARTPPSDPFGLIRRTHAFVGDDRRVKTRGGRSATMGSSGGGGGGGGVGGPSGGGDTSLNSGGRSASVSGGSSGGSSGKRFSFFGSKSKAAPKMSYDSSGVYKTRGFHGGLFGVLLT